MTIREVYEQLLGERLKLGENSLLCWCHEDKSNSCSLNTINGLWTCHATGTNGNLIRAWSLIKKVSTGEAAASVAKLGIDVSEKSEAPKEEKPPIPASIKDIYLQALNHDEKAKRFALKQLGWNPETLKEFEIGIHEKTNRYTIPIYDEAGEIRNFRMYHAESGGVNKMISYGEGYGTARLFPIKNLDARTLLLCEGEKDCIRLTQELNSYGPSEWKAITGTGGASSWRSEWDVLFKGKDVYIIYDRDPAGEDNAQKIAGRLATVAREVKVVTLDISEPPGADITNYFQDSGKGWDDLRRLIDDAPLFTPQTKRTKSVRPVDNTVYKPTLAEASDGFFTGRKVEIKVIVAGKELAPFILPRDISFDCMPGSMGKLCDGCAMASTNGLINHVVEKNGGLIDLIRIPTDEAMRKIKADLGIVNKCPELNVVVEEYQNLEEVALVPEIDFSEEEHEYVTRTAYVAAHGTRTNMSSVAKGTTLPHPKTGQMVHFLEELKASSSSVEQFKMDAKKMRALKIFRPDPDQSVWEKFEEIAKDLSLNVTRIYGRYDLVMGVELAYHSVLNWSFQGKEVGKGWGDVLIIGDTRTGKTETVQALIYHYKLGEMSVGENTSFAGLVGGLKQGANRQWSIMWGKIPLNNKRLLVIDEMSGLPLEVIGAMSGIRSNGVAEMTKIETQRTMAQTRLIWLSNPRDDKSMSQYGHGVEAIRHLVGRPEDIARFDYVITAATNEVPITEINSKQHDKIAHIYTSDLCRNLLLWGWSRHKSQVIFDDAAVDRILELAIEQSGRYASSGGIPLVEGGNHRIKLAKIAVAAAVRMFSCDEAGENVVVKVEHADFAAEFLDSCYGKASLDYLGWSKTKLSATQIADSVITEAEDWCDKWPEYAELWLTKNDLRLEDFKTQFDLENKEAKSRIFQPLSKMRMIERGRSSTYQPTSAFIQVLKKKVEIGAVTATVSTGSGANQDDFPF